MSLIIVAKGPDAIAGSRPSFLNKKGKKVEIKTAAIMLKNIERPTMSPSIEFCQPIKAIAEVRSPQPHARKMATINSLRK